MLASVQEYHAHQAAASAVAFLNERRLRRRLEPEHQSREHTAALLRGATKHYERHVLAWYALGRVSDARAARERIRALECAMSRRPSTRLVEQ
jgi:hypothetical protein